jgi:hypothetical protein
MYSFFFGLMLQLYNIAIIIIIFTFMFLFHNAVKGQYHKQ